MKSLKTRAEVDAAMLEPSVVLYKHSTRCPVSLDAYDEMQRFVLQHGGGVPVYMVDVVADRPVSQYIAERTATIHQSPQVIVLRGGERVWCASHYAITARELAGHVGDGGRGTGIE